MVLQIMAVAAGAALGGVLRWVLGIMLNALWPQLALGTLVVNLLGGYIIGLLVVWLGSDASAAPWFRLLLITGFCGGLTTFSSFSAELALMLQEGRIMWLWGAIVLHVGGALAATLAGMYTMGWLRAV